MKNIIIIIIFVILFYNGKAQKNFIDTIKIDRNKPATIEFNEDVVFTLIGNNPYKLVGEAKVYKYYQISEYDNIVIIECGKEINNKISTITIKTQKNTYYGYIGYFDNPNKSFYPVKKSNEYESIESISENINGEIFKKTKENINQDTIVKRLKQVLELKPYFNDIADIKGGVVFQVSNIVNDLQYSYMKLIIQNNSSSTYKINGILFKFEEGKKGLFKSKDITNTEWINTEKIIYPQNKNIESFSYENVGIVVPLYNGSHGELMLKIIEDKGTRTAVIKIKSSDINNTQVF